MAVCEQVRSGRRARQGVAGPRWGALGLALVVSVLPWVAAVRAANDLRVAFRPDTGCIQAGEPVTVFLQLSNVVQSVIGSAHVCTTTRNDLG